MFMIPKLHSIIFKAAITIHSQADLIYCDTNTGTPLNTNIFAYCENNPIIHADKTEKFVTPLQWAMAAIGGIAGWFLGTGGSPGQIAKQLFSKKHIEDGIMKLGTSQMSIFNKVLLENY